MMADQSSCVYWSYRSDDGRYNPYNPNQSAHIEASYAAIVGSSGGKVPKHCSNVNLTINKTKYELNFVSMFQKNTTTGHIRPIQRVLMSIPKSPPLMGYWEWEESHGRYAPYMMQASIDIEIAVMGAHPSVDLSTTTACIPYTIDFTNRCQIRHGYNTIRRIRRMTLTRPLHELLEDQVSMATTKVTTRSKKKQAASTSTSSAPVPPSHGLSATKGYVTSVYHGSSGHVTSVPGHVTSVPGHFTSVSVHVTSVPGHVTSVPFSPSGHVTSSPSFTNPSLLPSSSIKKGKKSPPKTVTTTKTGKKPKKSQQDIEMTASNDAKDDILKKYVKIVSLNFGQNEPCPICMSDLTEFSGFEDEVGLPNGEGGASSSGTNSPEICKLRKCGHMLHRACLIMYMKNKSDGLMCPTCKKIHGVKTGDMPKGSMTHRITSYSLPGHPHHGTIEVTYNFTSGIQNGRRYNATGFPRTCYIPNSPKGQKVFKLLQVAWKRRLTFTIGTSVTTGAANTIVWNEIHHKTEAHGNTTGHGYPDDNYLDNALAELAAQGVEEGQSDDGLLSDTDTDTDDDDL